MKPQRTLLNIWLAVIILVLVVPLAAAGGPSNANDIKALYSQEKVMDNEAALVNFGPRVAGGPAEKAAAEWIAGQMMSYGLDVEIQEFPIVYYEELGPPVLQQVSPVPTTYVWQIDFSTMSYSGSGDATAPVQAVDLLMPPTGGSTSGCEATDFAGFVPGNIALIQRGTCTFAAKAVNAQAAGAVGVVIYNEGNGPGRTGVINGTLGGPVVTIPVVGTTYALGEQVYNELQSGPVVMHMDVSTASAESTSQNVIGTLVGTDSAQGIVYMGGHYDSVAFAPGANDDASGVAATLEAARVLSTTGHRTKATLKFIAFGAEETGLNGSYEYVAANEEEVATKGLGMINLDMIGVGDTLSIGTLGGENATLRDYTGAKATAMSMSWQFFTAGTNSDHTYFAQVGVPASFLSQGPDPYYHTSEDTLDKIQAATLEANGELATATMYDWAKNPALRAKKAMKLEKVHVYHDKVLEVQ
jgi:Zn-dependent M28 family amino/carboxypeptidase